MATSMSLSLIHISPRPGAQCLPAGRRRTAAGHRHDRSGDCPAPRQLRTVAGRRDCHQRRLAPGQLSQVRMSLPEQPGPRVVAASAVFAYLAFAATFRGPRPRFWQRMTGTAVVLGTTSILTSRELRRQRPRPRDLALGTAIAAGLYGVFAVGDRAARLVMPQGDQDIGNIYEPVSYTHLSSSGRSMPPSWAPPDSSGPSP